IDVTVGIGERLGVSGFNALYGARVDGVAPEEQDELALPNIVDAARAAAGIGATVFIEPVSGPKPYPLRTAADAAAGVGPAGAPATWGSCSTSTTSPPTATTSTAPSPPTPPRWRTSRSPTPPAAASRARASSTWTAIWPGWSRPATPAGSGWSTSRPCPPRTA